MDVTNIIPQSFYTIMIMENNPPQALLSSLTAVEAYIHENQYLVYFIIEKEIAPYLSCSPLSSKVTVHIIIVE